MYLDFETATPQATGGHVEKWEGPCNLPRVLHGGRYTSYEQLVVAFVASGQAHALVRDFTIQPKSVAVGLSYAAGDMGCVNLIVARVKESTGDVWLARRS